MVFIYLFAFILCFILIKRINKVCKVGKTHDCLIALVLISLILYLHTINYFMHDFGKTIQINRQTRLLAEIFEMLDVNSESDCENLKYQVSYIARNINYVLHDDEKLVELHNYLFDMRTTRGERGQK